ncbi:uncharacterized protein LOC102706259 [Oryza brachyantha]|uniref:uncharacterized protein LOC102706259 n=1 Tax=Oryza brachyantha TaxID=4533 RepID=UPI001ADBAD65|nr:uncharacterized protein LOC102706259 [Oryza brachyantha]
MPMPPACSSPRLQLRLHLVVYDRYEAEPGESCKDLAELLCDDDRAVRMAAGEALAVCVELKLAHDTSPKDMAVIRTTVSDLAIESTGNGADDEMVSGSVHALVKRQQMASDVAGAEQPLPSRSPALQLRAAITEQIQTQGKNGRAVACTASSPARQSDSNSVSRTQSDSNSVFDSYLAMPTPIYSRAYRSFNQIKYKSHQSAAYTSDKHQVESKKNSGVLVRDSPRDRHPPEPNVEAEAGPQTTDIRGTQISMAPFGKEFRQARGGKNGGGKYQKCVARDEKPIRSRFVNTKEPVECTILENIDECIVELFEKRGYTREEAVLNLVRMLEGFKFEEDIRCKYGSIVSRCIFSLKKGSRKEACLAYRALGILALNLGGGQWRRCHHRLQVHSGRGVPFPQQDGGGVVGHGEGARCARSLAATTFAGEDRNDEIERSMDDIWDGVIEPRLGSGSARKTTPQVLATAVSAWAFLLTVVHDRYEAEPGESCKDKIAVLAELLYDDDSVVWMAAGEALAVCVELKLAHDTSPKDMAAIRTTVSNLANESTGNGGTDKRQLADQRNVFRRIEEFLGSGKCPAKSVQASSNRQHVLKVSTWTKLLQLNFLTRFLGNGFQSHLKKCPLFEETFERQKQWTLELKRTRGRVGGEEQVRPTGGRARERRHDDTYAAPCTAKPTLLPGEEPDMASTSCMHRRARCCRRRNHRFCG